MDHVAKFEKTKAVLEWLEHGRFVVEVLVGLGGGTATRALLLTRTRIPSVWVTPIWLFIAAILTTLAVFWGNKLFPLRTVQVTTQDPNPVAVIPAASSLIPGASGPTFNAKEFFRTAYYSTLTAEAEKNLGAIATQNEPANPQAFLLRFIGVGLVAYLHDFTWWTIFRSQLLMLLAMNGRNGYMPLTEGKDFYDKAAVQYPQIYSTYSFAQWIAYMKQQQLILQHQSNMLEITVTGKDFLKYLTHWGLYPDARTG